MIDLREKESGNQIVKSIPDLQKRVKRSECHIECSLQWCYSWLLWCHHNSSNRGAASAECSVNHALLLSGCRHENMSAGMWYVGLHYVQQDFKLIGDGWLAENLSGAPWEPMCRGEGHFSGVGAAEWKFGTGEVFYLLLTHRRGVFPGRSFLFVVSPFSWGWLWFWSEVTVIM